MLIFLKTVEGQSRCGTLGLLRLRTSETRPGVIRAGPFRSREREWAARWSGTLGLCLIAWGRARVGSNPAWFFENC